MVSKLHAGYTSSTYVLACTAKTVNNADKKSHKSHYQTASVARKTVNATWLYSRTYSIYLLFSQWRPSFSYRFDIYLRVTCNWRKIHAESTSPCEIADLNNRINFTLFTVKQTYWYKTKLKAHKDAQNHPLRFRSERLKIYALMENKSLIVLGSIDGFNLLLVNLYITLWCNAL